MLTPRIAIVLALVGALAPALAAAQSTDQTTREQRMEQALKDFQSGKPAQTASMPPAPAKKSSSHGHTKH